MTKALTLQFANGFRAHPHFGGKAHVSLSVEIGTLGTRLRGAIAVRLCEEGLSFVGEMIYLTVELNFHKTIIFYINYSVKSRLIGLKSIKSCAK